MDNRNPRRRLSFPELVVTNSSYALTGFVPSDKSRQMSRTVCDPLIDAEAMENDHRGIQPSKFGGMTVQSGA